MALTNVIIIVFCQRCPDTAVVQKPSQDYLSGVLQKDADYKVHNGTWLCPVCESKRLALVESNRVAVQDFMAGKTPGKVAT